ncbi:DEAD/DEAH box helicase, partial [Herbaspirillum frisingense]
MEQRLLQVALDTPLHTVFDYRWKASSPDEPLPAIGQLVVVPFGRREAVGVVVGQDAQTDLQADKIKDVIAVRHQLPPMSAHWMALCGFAADYYQRPLGEVMLPGLPKNLRALTTVALDKALKALGRLAPATKAKLRSRKKAAVAPTVEEAIVDPVMADPSPDLLQLGVAPSLNPSQQQAVDAIVGAEGFAPLLLYGVTGSGKTEVYLQAAAAILRRAAEQASSSGSSEPGQPAPAPAPAQILVLVPEINLTPQLEGNIRARFPHLNVVALHSGLAEGERARNWLAAHLGQAHIVLGTRLAILSSLPSLKLIVIDEEHDPSYKQQEGLRYSARDLAVWRAHQLGIPVVLGSATPSLETWQHAQA